MLRLPLTFVLFVAHDYNLIQICVATILAHEDEFFNPTTLQTMRTMNFRKYLAHFGKKDSNMSPVDDLNLCGRIQEMFGALLCHQRG